MGDDAEMVQQAQNAAVGAAADDTGLAAKMRVVVAMEEVVRKAERQIVQVAVLQEEDADQKAAEMDSGTAGMAEGTTLTAATVVGLREIRLVDSESLVTNTAKLGGSQMQRGNHAEEAAEVAKDAEELVVETTKEITTAA